MWHVPMLRVIPLVTKVPKECCFPEKEPTRENKNAKGNQRKPSDVNNWPSLDQVKQISQLHVLRSPSVTGFYSYYFCGLCLIHSTLLLHYLGSVPCIQYYLVLTVPIQQEGMSHQHVSSTKSKQSLLLFFGEGNNGDWQTLGIIHYVSYT